MPITSLKLIKTDFIRDNNLYYNNYRCLEDVEYSCLVVLKAKSILFLDEKLVNYREEREGSLISKRVDFVENIVKDTQVANRLVADLPKLSKIYFLNYIYYHLFITALEAFYCSKISFVYLRQILEENINSDVLFEYENHRYYSGLYKKILNYNEFRFRLSYCSREFFKRTFPEFWNFYLKIKRSLREFFNTRGK